ncbi:hypothetical protein TNCV_3341141 [Trichonephila clavipes]|nr:hypothetical protein TNCV_3341141 [Trichonephila clavipes]
MYSTTQEVCGHPERSSSPAFSLQTSHSKCRLKRQAIQKLPLASHQIHSRTFPTVSPGLATVCATSLRFDHDRFRTILPYETHFLSPVTIRLRNGLISFRLAKDGNSVHHSFGVNRCCTQTNIKLLFESNFAQMV